LSKFIIFKANQNKQINKEVPVQADPGKQKKKRCIETFIQQIYTAQEYQVTPMNMHRISISCNQVNTAREFNFEFLKISIYNPIGNEKTDELRT
jgi:hypothetical protein